jgi:hypothetical protein
MPNVKNRDYLQVRAAYNLKGRWAGQMDRSATRQQAHGEGRPWPPISHIGPSPPEITFRLSVTLAESPQRWRIATSGIAVLLVASHYFRAQGPARTARLGNVNVCKRQHHPSCDMLARAIRWVRFGPKSKCPQRAVNA